MNLATAPKAGRTRAGARRSLVTLALSLAAVSLASCGRDAATAPLVAATVTISAPSGSLSAGGTMQFAAVVKDSGGKVIALPATWTIVNGGGTITADGLFTATDSAGVYLNTVKATSGAVSSLTTVTVVAGSLASITVAPLADTLGIGETMQFTATGSDAHGNAVAIAPTWSVVASGGTVDTSGLFTAGTTSGAFTNTMRATVGEVSGSGSVVITPGALATIVVTPDSVSIATGATQQFSAVGTDAHGNVVSIVPHWSVVAGGGTIDETGLFTADSTPGNYPGSVRASISQHCFVIAGSSTVTVTSGVVPN